MPVDTLALRALCGVIYISAHWIKGRRMGAYDLVPPVVIVDISAHPRTEAESTEGSIAVGAVRLRLRSGR